MSDYRDFWREFRTIIEGTKKKLLKKPNWSEAIARFRNLSQEFIDEEQPENAAICHVEIANIYGRTANHFQQRLHLIEAAKLFYLAKYARYSLKMSTIHKAINAGYVKIAGMTCLELACKLIQVEKFEDAHRYLVQGNRFIQPNIFIQLAIIDKLVVCGLRIIEIDELLFDLVVIWSNIMKNQPFHGQTRESMRRAECNIILLHLKRHNEIKILPKSFLVNYAQEKRNPKISVLDPEEYDVVAKFIVAIKSRDYPTSSSVHFIHFHHYLNQLGKEMALNLVDSIRPPYNLRKQLAEISDDGSLSEREKRTKLFEFYNSLARTNRPSIEFL